MAVFAIAVQIIIISYNHFNGYFRLEGAFDLLIRLLYSSVFTFAGGLLLAYPDLFLIRFLNRIFPWKESPLKRIGIELLFLVIFGLIISIAITLLAHAVDPYDEGLLNVLWVNMLITVVVNLFLISALEGIIFFREGEASKRKAVEMQQEIGQLKYEVLKNQINPHFMFNSLNVLSGLIDYDTEKAQRFVEEFSSVYRYVLETIEKPVVSVREELSFIRSYMFLQKMRYGGNLSFAINLEEKYANYYLPPLSLQLVMENAMKHNIINNSHQLFIEIFQKNGKLLVRNNMRAKISSSGSFGVGQLNLKKRYEMIWHEKPVFRVETNHYVAELPLIKPDE